MGEERGIDAQSKSNFEIQYCVPADRNDVSCHVVDA